MRFPCSENVRCPGGVPSTASAHGCPPRGCEQNWAHSTSRATSGLGGAPPTPAPPPTADVSQPTDSGRCRGRCANTSTPPSRLRCNCSGTGNRGGRGGVSPRRAHPKDAAGCPVSRPEWGEADLHSRYCNCPTKTHPSTPDPMDTHPPWGEETVACSFRFGGSGRQRGPGGAWSHPASLGGRERIPVVPGTHLLAMGHNTCYILREARSRWTERRNAYCSSSPRLGLGHEPKTVEYSRTREDRVDL